MMDSAVEEIEIEKYSGYKESGVPGLGQMPIHWELLSTKHIFTIKKIQVGKKSGDYVLLSLTLGGVIKRDMENPQGKFPAEFNTYQQVKSGDFIFCLFDVEETPRTIGLSDFDGMITGAYTVMEANQRHDRSFLYYFFLNLDSDKRLRSLYTGLRNIISKENFLSYKIFVPPLPEQAAIARFLDRKTALIDKAIAIKEKQIELLKERRQVLIHKAVTCGLNPNVKMKDSGVEWIAEVPEHWEVKRLRYIANCLPSNVDKHAKANESQVRLCNYTDVYKNEFITDDMKFMSATATIEQIQKYSLKLGDVVITKDSETANDIAVPAYVVDELTNVVCGYHLAIVRPNSAMYGRYLFRAFQCKVFNIQFEVCSNGITRVGLGNSDLKKGQFFVPPLTEQRAIAEFSQLVSDGIRKAIAVKRVEIERLMEYKSTLVNSAVTGKIKVC
jgi:type I restriction enzyme S subunit